MTRTEVTDLLSKAKYATPGPWKYEVSPYIYNGQVLWCEYDESGITVLSSFEQASKGNGPYIAAANPESITRLAESYLQALQVIDWYAVDDDVGVAARKFLRKIGET